MARAGNHAMREDGNGQMLEIVGQAEVTAFKKRPRLCGALQHQSAPGAYPQCKLVGFAGSVDDFKSVIVKAGVNAHAGHHLLHRENIGDISHRLHRSNGIVAGTDAQNLAFGFVGGITHFYAHQKTIKLGFGKRVGAVMLDGVLRGDHKKGLWQRHRAAVDGHLRFVHGFQQG